MDQMEQVNQVLKNSYQSLFFSFFLDFKNEFFVRIVRFRWIIPSNGEIRVRLRFVSNEVGQFDQTISFEILGTKRNYKIFCRGVCTFPTISREPRLVLLLFSLFVNSSISLVLSFLIDKKIVNQMKLFIRNLFFQLNNMILVH
jgi:hypothetical protein